MNFNFFVSLVLGRIFRRVGANFETKQLDIYKKNLSMQLTNEFIHNNINILNDDLQLFIQLFLERKQKTGFSNRKENQFFFFLNIYLFRFSSKLVRISRNLFSDY